MSAPTTTTKRQTVTISFGLGYDEVRLREREDKTFVLERHDNEWSKEYGCYPIGVYDTPDEAWEALRKEVGWNA